MEGRECPVLHPSTDEFADFYSYILKVEEKFKDQDVGLCKIVPPSTWAPEIDYEKKIEKFTVKNPVQQLIAGKGGVFSVNLLELNSLPLPYFRSDAEQHSRTREMSDLETEKCFWKELSKLTAFEAPIYGGDIPGSFFNENYESSWNVAKLDSILSLLPDTIPGVNTPMMYIGMWKAMFSYHVEDYNLYSINYLHYGSPKYWYSVNPSDKKRFEALTQSYFGGEFKQCKEFLRHKTTMISPNKLKEAGISFTTMVHRPGEFIITFPGSYHAGFNGGFNIAESTNFATPYWLQWGKISKKCLCQPFCVAIDVPKLERKFLIDAYKNHNHKYLSNDMVFPIECSCGALKFVNPVLAPKKKKNRCGKVGMEMDNSKDCMTCLDCHTMVHILCADKSVIDMKKCKECLFSTSLMENNANDKDNVDVNAHGPGSGSKNLYSSSYVACNSKKRALTDFINNGGIEENAKLGNIVFVKDDNGNYEELGIVKAMEESCCRVHSKGSRKEDDIWIDMNEDIYLFASAKVAKHLEDDKVFDLDAKSSFVDSDIQDLFEF